MRDSFRTTRVVAVCLAVFAASGAGALAAEALLPAGTLSKPGTTPALSPPHYSPALPAYLTPANSVAGPWTVEYTQLAGAEGITGTVTSTVYRNPTTGLLTFKYRFTSAGASALFRATIGGGVGVFPWGGVAITDAGADGSGSSTPPANQTPAWSDGDPHSIERDPSGSLPGSGEGIGFQWLVESKGTSLDPARGADVSSDIFVCTNAVSFTTGWVTLIGSFSANSYAQVYVPDEVAAPSIHIEKATNGHDADVAPGPTIPVGGPVTWTYVVTNTGDVPLSAVVVSDDKVLTTTLVSGDTNGNNVLEVTEVWTYQATGLATEGQYENLGTVVAMSGGIQVSDTDPSHYFAEKPDDPPAVVGIDIEKATNGEDADTPTGPVVPVGSLVTWTYVVTNIGEVPLTNVTVTDDQGVVVTLPVTTLAPGASTTGTATGTAVAGQYQNLATATGTTPDGDDVTDSDPSHYFGTGFGCTYTQGFWKNHAGDWPVQQITLGGVGYTKAAALDLLRTRPRGDATIILAHQLIAAKLNVASGADATAVSAAIVLADAWLEGHPVGSDPKGPSRAAGIDVAGLLDDYNNGIIGPGHCDDDPGDVEDAKKDTDF